MSKRLKILISVLAAVVLLTIGGAAAVLAESQPASSENTTATKSMDSTPPSPPALLQPEMGAKAKAEAHFDWTEVTDPSGVTYTLQIANGEEVFNSEAAESYELEKTGLTLSEYTLAKSEKLQPVSKKRPLYWRVKAVDGASNESEWSNVGSFYVGFYLSQQSLIYGIGNIRDADQIKIIIGIFVVILALLAFWLGRRICSSRM